jgi:hypothetical protein
MHWNSVLFWTGLTRAAKAGQKSLVPSWRAQQTNQGRTPLICTLWVPICLSSTVSRGAHPSVVYLGYNNMLRPSFAISPTDAEKIRISGFIYHVFFKFFSCRLFRHSNLQRILHVQSNRKNARLTKKPQTYSSVAEFFTQDLPYKETICFGSIVGNSALFLWN